MSSPHKVIWVCVGHKGLGSWCVEFIPPWTCLQATRLQCSLSMATILAYCLHKWLLPFFISHLTGNLAPTAFIEYAVKRTLYVLWIGKWILTYHLSRRGPLFYFIFCFQRNIRNQKICLFFFLTSTQILHSCKLEIVTHISTWMLQGLFHVDKVFCKIKVLLFWLQWQNNIITLKVQNSSMCNKVITPVSALLL